MVTKWSRIKPIVQVHTRSSNIITHLPGPKGIACQAKSEIKCIRLLITDNIIKMITKSTNIDIQQFSIFLRESETLDLQIKEKQVPL